MDQIIDAVEKSELSRYRISQQTGIPESSLSRFVNRERGLSTENLEKLCEFLGLRIRIEKKRK